MSYYTTISFKIIVKPEYRSDMKYVAKYEWNKVSDGLLIRFHDAALPYTRFNTMPFGGKWDENTGVWEHEADYNWLNHDLEAYITGLIALIASHVIYYKRSEEDGYPWTYYLFDSIGNVYFAPHVRLKLKAVLRPEYAEPLNAFLKYDPWPDDPDNSLPDVLPFLQFRKTHQDYYNDGFTDCGVSDNILTLEFSIYDEDFFVEDLLNTLILPAVLRIEQFSIEKSEKREAMADTSFATAKFYRENWNYDDE